MKIKINLTTTRNDKYRLPQEFTDVSSYGIEQPFFIVKDVKGIETMWNTDEIISIVIIKKYSHEYTQDNAI